MLEKAIIGSKKYYAWLVLVLAVAAVGFYFYLYQLVTGSESSGLSRSFPWGVLIANYTFMVGVAASAVMVVLPYYLHNYKQFGRITVLGEFTAVAAVATAILFIMADIGRPERAFNLALYPTPRSPFFWNMVLLGGYMMINLVVGWFALDAERNSVPAPQWVRILSYISIPWAVSIHTMTSFVYSGLAARPFWHTAIMGPRFLATAFAAGPALLIVLCMIVRRISAFDPGRETIQKLAIIVCYAMIVNIFFILMEVFSAFYSGMHSHAAPIKYLWVGVEGHRSMVPYMWASALMGVLGVLLLLIPRYRLQESWLALACVLIFISTWIDKGMCLIAGGLAPTPFETFSDYAPTAQETVITIGVY
ncbi:MAG: polysulfide reductase NrfD, partial [Candidatus Sumerlaeia bacterium]|nr:polysulfide reductase NrfD [Candidatus Sumerlaeia bacterium]